MESKIKGLKIASLISIPKTKAGDIFIEIKNFQAIAKGVIVFARAWKYGKQIGFGKDGTVDLEKFVFINPPVLMDDPKGNMKRISIDEDGISRIRKLRYDPKSVILQDLAHTINVKKSKVLASNRIIRGKIGQTTLTARPEAGSGGANTTTDGLIFNAGVNETWATITGRAASTNLNLTGVNSNCLRITASATTDQWSNLNRSGYSFDTSSIGSGSTIDSAIITIYAGGDKVDSLGITPTIDIYAFTPADLADFVVGDFDQFGATSFASMTWANWDNVDTNPNDFTLNASGESSIDKTGVTGFMLMDSEFDHSQTLPSWTSGQTSRINAHFADETGTASDPKLVVEYTEAVSTIVQRHTLLTLNVG